MHVTCRVSLERQAASFCFQALACPVGRQPLAELLSDDLQTCQEILATYLVSARFRWDQSGRKMNGRGNVLVLSCYFLLLLYKRGIGGGEGGGGTCFNTAQSLNTHTHTSLVTLESALSRHADLLLGDSSRSLSGWVCPAIALLPPSPNLSAGDSSSKCHFPAAALCKPRPSGMSGGGVSL